MQLKPLRVQNCKTVHDTDWMSGRDLVIFVGKNEAGKSAVLRGLSN